MPDLTAEFDTVILDGMPFRVLGGVINVQNLSVFQRKFTIGDPTKDSHPVLSTWITTDLSGGHGVQILEEGTDTSRYRFGVIDTRRPRQITAPPLATQVTFGTTTNCYPLGELGSEFYLAYDTNICSWDEATAAVVDTLDDLTAVPTNKPVAFKGSLYIPLGSSYDTYDGTTVSNVNTHDAQAFMIWDSKLLMIETTGQIHWTLDGSTWTSYGADGLLDSSYTPRHLVPFYDRQEFAMPVVITDRDIWAFDPAGPALYRTEVQYPRHRDQGLGSAVWRGDLYSSVGMGVFRYNGNVISPMGLDRDQGLPSELRGKIVDLLPEYNGLYALVSGRESAATETETWEFVGREDDWYVSTASALSSLHIFTGFGWHCYWQSDSEAGLPTWASISSVDDTYRLWWGVAGDAYTMELPIDFANARALIDAGDFSFAATATLETGFFDASMASFTKIANAVHITTRYTSADQTIDVYYRADDSGYELLGTVSSPGETVLPFGALDSYGIRMGEPFKQIELKYVLNRDSADTGTAPLIENSVLSFLKVQPPSLSWTMKVDLTSPFMGNNPETMEAKIEELIASDYFFSMIHRDDVRRVRLAQYGGSEMTGAGDNRNERTLNLIEVPVSL